jgi:hypothetical protein
MDLRIEENRFVFRITPDNLETLLRGREIDHRVCVGSHCFTYRITPLTRKESMALEMAVAGFCLSVPKAALQRLRDDLDGLDTLTATQNGTQIVLSVDAENGLREAA